MAGSADQLATRLVAGGKNITRANRVGVEKACLAGKQVMLAALMSATGGKRKISKVGKSGANVNVRYRVYGYQNPKGFIRYVGPVHLLNNPISPHEILPRASQRTAKGNARRGAKALTMPDGNLAARVQHPGTAGKKFAERAEPIVLEQSERIIKAEVRGHLARTFSGR